MSIPEFSQSELQQIRREHSALTAQLAGLESRLAQLEQAAASPAPAPAPAPVTVAVAPLLPPPLPPPLLVKETPPPVVASPPVPPLLSAAPPASGVAPAVPAARGESLEMRIGGTWFVRVGIVLLLTSLAFLGSFLYTNVVPHLGPAAKVGLLYLAAGTVAGLGAWLEQSRPARESGRMRWYARIILAGGLAAVYYVTYAAHFYERLRVIPNALVAGTLLLGWASFMVWLADRRGSEALATVAILLAYYTSAINEGVAGFTLASNVVLSAGAVILLRRHLWRVFPFASLLASFGSYAFWNYFHSYLGWRGLAVPPSPPGGGPWIESAFLLVYWLLFTWAAFTAGEGALPATRRAGFAGLNNGAFFLLTSWLLLGDDPAAFWRWALAFGGGLLALAEVARRSPRQLDPAMEATYLWQGVLLVTLGFVTYFSGWQLSLVLAVQAVALVVAAGWRRQALLLAAAGAVGLLSFLGASARLLAADPSRLWPLALGEGGFLVLAAWCSQRLLDRAQSPEAPPDAPRFTRMLTRAPAYFSFLGLAVWLWLLEREFPAAAWNAPVLALAAVVLTASVYLLRIPAVPLCAQFYLVAAYVRWVGAYGGWTGSTAAPPVWNPLVLLAATLLLGHWWQRRSPVDAPRDGRWFPAANALLLTGVLFAWLQPFAGTAGWMAEGAGWSILLLAYGLATGYRALAVAGQVLLGTSAWLLLEHWQPAPASSGAMWWALGPGVAMLVTIAAARQDERARALEKSVAGTIYESAAMCLFLTWGTEYFPLTWQFTSFALAGGAVFALGAWRRERRWLVLSAAPTLTALVIFSLVYDHPSRRHWIHLMGVGCFAGQQWWGKRRLNAQSIGFPPWAQHGLITGAVLCGWALATAGAHSWRGSAFTLAVAWSIYAAAVFAAGLGLHERAYRWLGLGVLAAALARIALVDIWQLDSLARAVSAFCLAIILLGLGYLYNRYRERWNAIL